MRLITKLGQFEASFTNNTLNHELYPTSGNRLEVSIAGVYGSNSYRQNEIAANETSTTGSESSGWIQSKLKWEKYVNTSNRFTFGFKVDAVASTRPLGANYTALQVQANAFTPTPSTQNYFNTAFRSNSYAAAGVITVFGQLPTIYNSYRVLCFCSCSRNQRNCPIILHFMADGLNGSDYMGEASLIYNFQFAALSIYCNYLSYPARNWNFA